MTNPARPRCPGRDMRPLSGVHAVAVLIVALFASPVDCFSRLPLPTLLSGQRPLQSSFASSSVHFGRRVARGASPTNDPFIAAAVLPPPFSSSSSSSSSSSLRAFVRSIPPSPLSSSSSSSSSVPSFSSSRRRCLAFVDADHGTARSIRYLYYVLGALLIAQLVRTFLGESPLVARYLPSRLVKYLKTSNIALVDPMKKLSDPTFLSEFHAFTCGSCGYTIFPARGREGKFFPENYTCPSCGADAGQFFDTHGEDMSEIMSEEELKEELVCDGGEEPDKADDDTEEELDGGREGKRKGRLDK